MKGFLAALLLLLAPLAGCSRSCCGEHDHTYGERPPAGELLRAAPDVESDPNIVGDLSTWADRSFSHTPGSTVLEKVNYERKRLYGQMPIKHIDPDLHALALYKATYAAEHSIDGHIGGDQGDSTCEGVATTNGRFLSCCLDKPGTVCGCAMVQGRNGWFCCFLIR